MRLNDQIRRNDEIIKAYKARFGGQAAIDLHMSMKHAKVADFVAEMEAQLKADAGGGRAISMTDSVAQSQ